MKKLRVLPIFVLLLQVSALSAQELIRSASAGDLENVTNILYKECLDQVDQDGISALHYAVHNVNMFPGYEDDSGRSLDENFFEIIKLLLKNGANPNIQDRFGMTPLMYAAALPDKKSAIVELLKYKADKSLRDTCGRTAFDRAQSARRLEYFDLLYND